VATIDWSEWAAHAAATLTMARQPNDEAWIALFASGGTYQDPVTERTSDVAAVFAVTRSTFADWEMTVTAASGDASGGVMEWISKGHLPHGPEVILHGCSVIDLSADAKVLRWRDYFDMGEFTRQAGLA
jgi:hypothetical protein